MAYNKTIWKDRVVEKPRTYKIANNSDGTITLIPSPGTVTEQGTPITALVMNNIEDGIVNNENLLDDIYKRSFALGNAKICTNALMIKDEYDGYTGVVNGSTSNLPAGFQVGMRIQLRYDANNYVVKLYDTQSNKEWINFYNGVDWCGWREISLGEINLNKKPVCKLYRTTEQIVPVRTEIRVAWEHVLFQSHPNMYIPEANVNIYAPIKGLYRVNATVVVKSEQAGYEIACDMKKNASEYVVTDKCVSNSTTFNVMKLDGLYILGANDYFTITLSHANPSGMTIHPTSRIEIEYIREVF